MMLLPSEKETTLGKFKLLYDMEAIFLFKSLVKLPWHRRYIPLLTFPLTHIGLFLAMKIAKSRGISPNQEHYWTDDIPRPDRLFYISVRMGWLFIILVAAEELNECYYLF